MTNNMNACNGNNLLLTEHEGCTGKYWPECKVCTKNDQGPIFPSTALAS